MCYWNQDTEKHTWNIHLSPIVAPFTNSVLSRVILACRKAIRSTPVPLKVVGGPIMLKAPLGNCREPCVHILLFSSSVVISSTTRPYVSCICLVKLWKNRFKNAVSSSYIYIVKTTKRCER